MRNVGRRIRGGIGMVFAWVAAWFVAGGLLARVPGLVERMPGYDPDLPFPLLFIPFGLVTGVLFSGFFAVLEGRRGLDHVSRSRVAAWGAASGLPTAVVIANLRGDMFEVLVFGPVLALAGAVCAAGSLAVARRPSGSSPEPSV